MDVVQRLEVYASAYEWDVETQLSMAKRMLKVAERFGPRMLDEEFNLIDEEEKDWQSPNKSQSK